MINSMSPVLQELAARLETIAGLNVYTGWPSKVIAPAAIVAFPMRIQFDLSYGRGMDQYEVPVVVAVSRMPDEKALPELDAYSAGVGDRSVKVALESNVEEYAAFDGESLQVADVEFDVYRFAGVDYLAAVFSVRLAG